MSALESNLKPGEAALTDPGPPVHMSVLGSETLDEKCYNIIGYIAGSGAQLGQGQAAELDNQMIMVSA